jgi:hypothetical protein
MLSGDNETHTVLLSWVLTHPGLGTLDINLSQLSGVASHTGSPGYIGWTRFQPM